MAIRKQDLDVFPANLTTDPLLPAVRNVRAVLSAGTLYVWAEIAGGEVKLIGQYRADSAEQISLRHYRVETDVGTVTIKKAGHCGCNSPLKRFSPRARIAQLAAQ